MLRNGDAKGYKEALTNKDVLRVFTNALVVRNILVAPAQVLDPSKKYIA